MRIAVVGLGLIGGSVALALAEKFDGTAHGVLGYDPDPATRETAAARLPVTADPADLLDADIAVVAAPYRHLAAIAADVLPADRYSGLVTDVASVKLTVSRMFARHARFVGGHPMAGKETAGFAAAEPGLFTGCKWVLCLDEATSLRDWTALARLWTALGAVIVPTTAAAHDAAVARISHIEHLVATALTLNAAEPLTRTLGAGSFRDGTRVAASAPELIEGMVEGNRLSIFDALAGFDRELDTARAVISRAASGDAAPFRDWLRRAHDLRATWPPEPGAAERVPLTREALVELGNAGGWVEAVETEVALARRPRVQSTP
jgi:prephenate dehydrogenase